MAPPVNSRLVVLRKIMGPSNVSAFGDTAVVAYIPVENYVNEPNGNYGRFVVRVARA